MVLAFTEEQKQKIESNGIMVVEFKRRIISLRNTLVEDIWNVFQELVEKFIVAVNPIVKSLYEFFDSIRLAADEIRDVKKYPTSCRYKICKILSRCTGIEKRKLWKMTRHTRLARSCL